MASESFPSDVRKKAVWCLAPFPKSTMAWRIWWDQWENVTIQKIENDALLSMMILEISEGQCHVFSGHKQTDTSQMKRCLPSCFLEKWIKVVNHLFRITGKNKGRKSLWMTGIKIVQKKRKHWYTFKVGRKNVLLGIKFIFILFI